MHGIDLLYLVLYILGAVCFAVSAFFGRGGVEGRYGTYSHPLVPAGLFFWILVPLITLLQK